MILCCVFSIFDFGKISIHRLVCAAIKRDSISLLEFPRHNYIQVIPKLPLSLEVSIQLFFSFIFVFEILYSCFLLFFFSWYYCYWLLKSFFLCLSVCSSNVCIVVSAQSQMLVSILPPSWHSLFYDPLREKPFASSSVYLFYGPSVTFSCVYFKKCLGYLTKGDCLGVFWWGFCYRVWFQEVLLYFLDIFFLLFL